MPARVLLLTADSERRKRWSKALEKSTGLLLLDGSPDAQNVPQPDIVVSDHLPLEIDGADLRGMLARGQIGLVLVACPGTADVSLPESCSSRELRLACRLLAEIVRLRRQANRERRARRLLSQLANSDPLTGLENRRAWDDQLNDRYRRILAGSRSGCLILLDLDHFKRVNQQWGHLAGDNVLRQLGRDLSALAAKEGGAARLGGDEFAILLTGREETTVDRRAELVRKALCQKLILDETPVEITVSAGFAEICPDSKETPAELLARADLALRQAKRDGRDRSVKG
jgi:diguanylate cyclase (GGDEF)-like protein